MPIYSSKTLGAASSAGIGTVSTAATPVTALNSSNLDTQRRIILWSSGGDISGTSFTVVGTNITGQLISEVMLGSTAAAAPTQSLGDYFTVTSVTASGVPAFPVKLGTTTVGSNMWHNIETCIAVTNLGFALTMTSSANSVVASIEYTLDDPSGVTPSQIAGTIKSSAGATILSSKWPIIWTSTAFSSVAVNTTGAILTPINSWRLTVTSTSTATTVQAACVQSGFPR